MKKRELYNILSCFEEEKSEEQNSLSDRILFAGMYAKLFSIAARDGFIINGDTVTLTYDDEDFTLPLGMFILPENYSPAELKYTDELPIPTLMPADIARQAADVTFQDMLSSSDIDEAFEDNENNDFENELPDIPDIPDTTPISISELSKDIIKPELEPNNALTFLDIRSLNENDFTFVKMLLKIERAGCPKFDLVEAYIYPLIKAETDYNVPIAAYFYHNEHFYQTCSFDNEDKELNSLELEVINTKIKVRGKYVNGEFDANVQTVQPDIRITVQDMERHTGAAIGLTFIEPRPDTDVYYYVFRKDMEKSEFNLLIYDGTWVDYETRNPISILTTNGTKQLTIYTDEYSNIIAEVD